MTPGMTERILNVVLYIGLHDLLFSKLVNTLTKKVHPTEGTWNLFIYNA